MSDQHGWIGVDLDGTLALYDRWRGEDHIGPAILPMVERVKDLLHLGHTVRIFTARVDGLYFHNTPADDVLGIKSIRAWCLLHIGKVLTITNRKDFGMTTLYDDRAVRVEHNTGRIIQ